MLIRVAFMTMFTLGVQTQNVLQISFKLRLPLATTLAFGLFLTLCSKTEESETLKELASASNCPKPLGSLHSSASAWSSS